MKTMVSLLGLGFHLCHARAPAAGNLIAHAGKTEFDIDGAR